MGKAKTYGLILFAVMFLTVFPVKHVWADEVTSGAAVTDPLITEPTVSGPAITEPVVTDPVVSGSAVTGTDVSGAAIGDRSLQIKIKKKKQLSVTYDGTVVWSSSKPNVAKVSATGKVTALAVGDTRITARTGEKTITWKVRVVESLTHQEEWFEKNGHYYYFDEYGVKAVGRKTINGDAYYFDSKGHQVVGWVKIKDDYYYYHIGRKKNGYLETDTKVNGITIKKNGKAKLTSSTRDKVKYLTNANELCADYVNLGMSRKEALQKMYTLMATGEIISYYNYGPFKYSKNWDQYYVEYYFTRGIGDCYTTGCAFAYIATALGYDEVYAESSGGHGWCRIGEKYYDPNWGSWGTENIMDGFDVKAEDCEKKGRVNWKRNCKYSKKIS